MARLGPPRARIGVALAVAQLIFEAGFADPASLRAGEPTPPPVVETPAPTDAPPAAPAASPDVAPTAQPTALPTPTPTAEPTAAPTTPTPAPSSIAAPPAGESALPPLPAGATELVDARTEFSRTFRDASGKTTTEFYTSPIYYQPTGSQSFEPVVLGFRSSADPDLTAASARAPVTVAVGPPTGNDGFLVTGAGPYRVAFRLPADLAGKAGKAAPVVAGRVADHAGFLPGVDLRVIAAANGARSFFIWHEAPKEPTLRYEVDAPGLTLKPADDGSISLLDPAGELVGRIPRPYAVDSTPDELRGSGRFTDRVTLTLGEDGRTLAVSVDPDWLATAVYPVYVDPSTGWLYNAGSSSYGDAHIASYYPTQNFDNYCRPDSPYYCELWNGTDPGGLSGVSYDFLRWNLSSLANTTIDSATLRMFPYHQYYNSPTSETTYARRVTEWPDGSWNETDVTWNNKPANPANTTSEGCVEGAYCDFDVKTIVQAWTKGAHAGFTPATNYGFQLDTIGKGSTYWKRFISAEEGGDHRPKLSVTYHTPTADALYPAGGGSTSSTTLTWAYSDSGGAGQTRYQVDVDTESSFASPLAASSGDTASSATGWAISTALTPGTTYYWRVKAYNGTSWSAWSTTASFVHDLGTLGRAGHLTFETWDIGAGDELAVNVATRNLTVSHPIVSLPIRGSALSLALAYNSHDSASVGFGPGWRLDVQRRLALNADGTVTFIDADGARHAFTNPVTQGTVTTYTRPATLYATLVKDTGNAVEFTLTYRDQSRDTFDIFGTTEALLTRAEDRYGNGVTLAYVGGTNRIATITDTAASRTVDFAYDGSGRLTSITDWAWIADGVVQSTATGARRQYRFFYDGSGTLIGWSDPSNTTGSCPTAASHLTCLAYTGGLLTSVTKTQTYTTLTSGALGTSTRQVTTQVLYAGAEVSTVKNAEEGAGDGTLISRTAAGETQVIRQGSGSASLDTTTKYVQPSATDSLGRISSAKRKLGAAWIERRTTYDATYPIEPATVVDNYVNGIVGDGANPSVDDRTTTYTYQANSLGLLSRVVERLVASDTSKDRWTDYTYNANNDVVTVTVSQAGSTDDTTPYRVVTRSCWSTQGATLPSDLRDCPATTGLHLRRTIERSVAGGATDDDTNVATDYTVDTYGRTTFVARHNRSTTGATLDDRVTGYVYESAKADLLAEIANYANGTVTSPGDDITPNATTGARTDLTTAYTYDTAGNRISAADPRRAIGLVVPPPSGPLVPDDYITRWTFEPGNQQISEKTPTTPGVTITQKTATTAFDELGAVRTSTDFGGLVTATLYDMAGRAVTTYEDPDGTGGTAAYQTGAAGYDPSGRLLWSEDQIQANDDPASSPDPGRTQLTYDELGRLTVSEAASQAVLPNGSPDPARSSTTFAYDALDRETERVVGTESPDAQRTRTGYDLGGRAIQVDDEFTCTTTTVDYRDLATQVVEGRTPGTPCSGGTGTINQAHDALGRLTSRAVAGGDTLEAHTFDAAGRASRTWSASGTTSRVTETTHNALDEPITEYAYTDTGGTKSGETWARANHDPAGNATDRCTWTAAPTESCHLASDTVWASPVPATRSSSRYDARNNRVELYTPGLGKTTYDPEAAYQVAGVYVPTAAGKEHQTLYEYDGRNRLESITFVLCATSQQPCSAGNVISTTVADDYAYDGNDSRTMVAEDNGAGAVTRHYCYDARNQLTGVYSAAGCSSGLLESDGYDAAGNRTSAAGRTFTYTAAGQLESCSGTACNPVFDADGRLIRITAASGTWSYLYDAESRLTSACNSTSCAGSGFARLDLVYDGEGHRIRLVETPASGTATTTDFRYEGEAVVGEVATTGSTVVTRTFTLDEAGTIVKMAVATTGGSTADDGTYLVTWNGHGDALALAEIDPLNGTLTRANRFSYSTWGTPTLAIETGYGDLGFRYRYVGRYGVAWDGYAGAAILYMQARHYSPEFGRFLQPDPAGAEANLYAYAGNSPVTRVDPSGLYAQLYRTENIEIPPWLADAASAASAYVCGTLFYRINHPLVGGAASLVCALLALGTLPRATDRVVHSVYRRGSYAYDAFTYYERTTSRLVYRGHRTITYLGGDRCARYLARSIGNVGLARMPLLSYCTPYYAVL